MYPESLLQWLVGVSIVFGILALFGAVWWWADTRYQRHIEKHHGAPKDDEQ